jgi:hypothetical protein
VLDFPPKVQVMLTKAFTDGFEIHSIRFDYEFKYYSPYNTNDVTGFKHALGLLCQFLNPQTIQYYFNIASTPVDNDQHQLLKSTLMRPGSEYSLALDWHKHV